MENMDEHSLKQTSKSESVSRSHSQELLDSSSASSLSVFADHSDGQNSSVRTNDLLIESRKSAEYSPRASMDEALKSEAAFIQYLTSIPPKESSELHRSSDSMITRNRSPAAGSTVSKVGLDHLDNLCKLMEQLGELRDTNSKLQKRVQYLEDLKTLHDMHKEICEGIEYSSEDALTPKPALYQLKKSATESHCPKEEVEEVPTLGYSRSPSKYLSRRGRQQQPDGKRRGRSKSVGHEDLNEDTKSRRLFPKWSKVKEAFGWESERKESLKIKHECDAILTSRRRSDESRQVYRHPGPTWYQDFTTHLSSTEDVDEDFEEGRWKKASVVSDKFIDQLSIPQEGLNRQKSTPSPGSDKVASFREISDMKPKSFTLERDTYRNQDYSKEDGKRGKSPWGRVKTIIERHRDSLKRRSVRRDQPDLESATDKASADLLDFKSYVDYLESTPKQSVVSVAQNQKIGKPTPLVIDQEMDSQRTPSSSPTSQRKSRWNRVTKVLKGKKESEKDSQSLSTPTSPNNQQDGNFTFDVIEEIPQNSITEGREITRIGSESHVHQLALSVPSSDLMLQLQRNLSEDFHRKILEWDRIRASGNVSSSPKWDRKPSDSSRTRKKSERDEKNLKPKIKDLSWLEKELQKIEKEKQRLSKERQKYEERALRLEKLKETVLSASNSNKREVLVRTSAGEFRFEGISDAFTKKLYEWETKRGVGPELSTIALLDSSRLTAQVVSGSKAGPLQRVLSKSESSIADIGQPSHNSSNSLPSVKLPDSIDGDKQTHASRANSEPDLSTLAAFTNGASLSVPSMTRPAAESTERDLEGYCAGKESEEDEFDKQRKGSETYYGLLEENVILLEQLREKEDICRRLEKDLEILDEKMDEMNARHCQETQRYRDKLWEMHQQGVSPRDVLCCRRTMEQLRKRIEVLEKWTKKLKSDRETVEVNFRHHSKEQENMALDLLGKMRELQAAGSSTADNQTGQLPRMDANTIERLQDLSVLLTKQTRDLEETLSEKTRQICQLKWELLHRDLSSVKLETEQHTHSVQRKRSKYANWRSRSSEEPPVSICPQKVDPSSFQLVATDVYCTPSPLDEFKATHLANTVQQLNKEVLKLTSATSTSSLSNSLQDENLYSNAVNSPKIVEGSRNHKKNQSNAKVNMKRITVRRSSADNLSLVSAEDNRIKDDCSTTESDESSDEYYSRICYNSGANANFPNNSDTERLLMSYGENPPRGYHQRKMKVPKTSKFHARLGRKRSNTFHTNRDLQKPTIIENVPQKCQSFRVVRENNLDDSSNEKVFRRKFQNSHFNVQQENPVENCSTQKDQNPQETVSLKNSVGKIESLENYNLRWLREVASDSKIPFLVEAQNLNTADMHAARSISEKGNVPERREHIQKKRNKRRFKSPDPSFVMQNVAITKPKTIGNTSHHAPKSNEKSLNSTSQILLCTDQKIKGHNLSQVKDTNNSFSNNRTLTTEIPTVTIQLPKRKLRKPSYSVSELKPAEVQTFTIVFPKKRSLSSECESSISEHSPREGSRDSDRSSNQPASSFQTDCTRRSYTDSHITRKDAATNTNGNIRLMRLVSLDNFETPFDQNRESSTKDCQPVEQKQRKRKAENGEFNGKNSPSEEMVDMISTREDHFNRSDSHNLNRSSTADVGQCCSDNTSATHYVKSPSAPQLDWRKTCAKKISKAGAPNVRTLIERYNQKLIENQPSKSPLSSNVSSPSTPRKTSNPTKSCYPQELVPRFYSTPNSPTSSPLYMPLSFRSTNSKIPNSPPSSPLSVARAEALRIAKENFIAPQISAPNSPLMSRTINSHQTDSRMSSRWLVDRQAKKLPSLRDRAVNLEQTRSEEDRMSSSSMDSMSLVMLRAGENCRESRLPKRTSDIQKCDSSPVDGHNLKTSKSLSSSSLFKTVLSSEFKMPAAFLKLKRSRRKKDMSAVTELCRQSLLLTTADTKSIPTSVSYKSCPSSPELKPKNLVKSNWLQRNIFRQK